MLVEHVRELLNGFSSGHADATDNWLQSDGICDRRKCPLLLLQTEARATALLVKAHKMHWMLEQLRFWLLSLHCLMPILLRLRLLLLLIHLKEHFITIVLDFVQTARGCCSGCSATQSERHRLHFTGKPTRAAINWVFHGQQELWITRLIIKFLFLALLLGCDRHLLLRTVLSDVLTINAIFIALWRLVGPELLVQVESSGYE